MTLFFPENVYGNKITKLCTKRTSLWYAPRVSLSILLQPSYQVNIADLIISFITVLLTLVLIQFFIILSVLHTISVIKNLPPCLQHW